MVYIVGLVVLYSSIILSGFAKYEGKFFIFPAILFLGCIAIFRGSVGTDTFTYEEMTALYRFEGGFSGWEPGFAALIKALQIFTENDRFVVRGVSAVFVFLLLLFTYKAKLNDIYFLSAFYIPVFFFSHSMNVLRLGLASVALLLAWQFYRDRIFLVSVLLIVMAVIFHYSVLFVVLFFWLVFNRLSFREMAQGFSVIMIILLAAFFLNHNYFLDKFDLYSISESPSSLSGMSVIAQVLLVLAGVCFCSLERRRKKKIISFSVLFCSVFYVISFYSYAGLRFLSILLFSISFSIMCAYGRDETVFDKYIKIVFLASGILSAVNSYFGYLNDFDLGDSPFLPYSFIWS